MGIPCTLSWCHQLPTELGSGVRRSTCPHMLQRHNPFACADFSARDVPVAHRQVLSTPRIGTSDKWRPLRRRGKLTRQEPDRPQWSEVGTLEVNKHTHTHTSIAIAHSDLNHRGQLQRQQRRVLSRLLRRLLRCKIAPHCQTLDVGGGCPSSP